MGVKGCVSALGECWLSLEEIGLGQASVQKHQWLWSSALPHLGNLKNIPKHTSRDSDVISLGLSPVTGVFRKLLRVIVTMTGVKNLWIQVYIWSPLHSSTMTSSHPSPIPPTLAAYSLTDTLIPLLFPEQDKNAFASGPLHLLFPFDWNTFTYRVNSLNYLQFSALMSPTQWVLPWPPFINQYSPSSWYSLSTL